MKILVIEDEKRIANSIKKGLEFNGHIVDVTYDGESGCDFACTEEYDCIVLDRMLPGKDGIQIIEDLRKKKKKTPVLMLTAKSQVSDKVTGLEAGADDYLSKPFAFEELLARIKALTRRPSQVYAETLSIDTLEINLNSHRVTRSGKSIKLSKREFALMEFLVRNQETVFSAQKIIERVWEFESDITENAVQVYIGYLRKKIDKHFKGEKALIQTIRGFGYKMSKGNSYV